MNKAQEDIYSIIEDLRAKRETKLPTEAELIKSLNYGRHTIREVINSYVNQGILEKVQGKGTFIIDKKTAINFLGWISTEAPGDSAFQFMQEQFEKDYPKYKITSFPVQYYHNIDQILHHSFQCHSLDVIQLSPAMLGFLQDINFLRPLDEYIDHNDITRRYQVDIESNRIDKKLMGLTWALSPIVLFYNKKVMEESGLDVNSPPTTLEELKKQCEVVNKSSLKNTWGISLPLSYNDPDYLWFYPYFLSFHGGFLDSIGNIIVDNEKNIEAMKWLKDLYKKGAVPGRKNITEGRILFASDRTAFLLDGPWMKGIFRNISSYRNEFDSHYGVTTVPSGPSGKSESFLFNHILAIPNNCPDPDKAYSFINFLTSNESVMNYYYLEMGMLPPMRDVLNQDKFSSDPFSSIFVKQMETVSALPISHPYFIKSLPFASQIVSDIITKNQDPKEQLGFLKNIINMLSQNAFISVYSH